MFRGTRRDVFAHTEFELDSDDLDGRAISQLEVDQHHSRSSSRSHRSSRRPGGRDDGEQSMPLLVGLLDSASARRGPDGTLQVEMSNGYDPEDEVDLDALAAKQDSGGSLLDSVANMANSILGAGEFTSSRVVTFSLIIFAQELSVCRSVMR